MSEERINRRRTEGTEKKVERLLRSSETIQQLRMNSAETAVAENADDVSTLGLLFDMLDNRIDVWKVGDGLAGFANIFHEPFGIEALGGGDLLESSDLSDDDLIGIFECGNQLGLRNNSPGCVRAWLENRPDPLPGKTNTQST